MGIEASPQFCKAVLCAHLQMRKQRFSQVSCMSRGLRSWEVELTLEGRFLGSRACVLSTAVKGEVEGRGSRKAGRAPGTK